MIFNALWNIPAVSGMVREHGLLSSIAIPTSPPPAILFKCGIKSRLSPSAPHSRFSSGDAAEGSIVFASSHIKLLVHTEFKNQAKALRGFLYAPAKPHLLR